MGERHDPQVLGFQTDPLGGRSRFPHPTVTGARLPVWLLRAKLDAPGIVSIAICINCGNVKAAPIELCAVCGFQPVSAEEKVKSIILSTEDIGDAQEGKSKAELLGIAPLVASGVYRFDEGRVSALAREGERVMSMPARVLLLDFIKWFGPPLLLLLSVLLLLKLTR
jgi:hypothetical protein